METQPRSKQDIFNEKVKSLDSITDGLGLGIEDDVKEMIAALNLLGMPTSSSCAGHNEESDISLPHMQGKTLDEPPYRYIGEEGIVEDLKKRYSLESKGEIFDGGEIEDKYYSLIDDLEETEEYKEWYGKNAGLRQKVTEIVNEFNNQNLGHKLMMVPVYPGYRIEMDTSDYESEVPVAEMREIVLKAQEAFKAFTEFLKGKYFSGETA